MADNLRAMIDELVASVAELERSIDGDARVAGWVAAHRERLGSLRLAFDREAEMLDELPELTLGRLGLAVETTSIVESVDATDMKSAVRAYKRQLVERALHASAGSNTVAARLLGVHPKYLYQLVRELDLPAPVSGPVSTSAKKTLNPVPASVRKA